MAISKKLTINLANENNCEGCRFFAITAKHENDIIIADYSFCALSLEKLDLHPDCLNKPMHEVVAKAPRHQKCPLEEI